MKKTRQNKDSSPVLLEAEPNRLEGGAFSKLTGANANHLLARIGLIPGGRREGRPWQGHKKQGRRRSIPSTTLPAPDIEIGSRHPVNCSMTGNRTGICEAVHKRRKKKLRQAVLSWQGRREYPATDRPPGFGLAIVDRPSPRQGRLLRKTARGRQPCDLPRLRCALWLAGRLRVGSAAGSVACVLANDCRSPLIASVSAPT